MRMKVYCGRPKPLTAVGVHQVRLLGFAEKYRGWHSYNVKCRATKRAIDGLLRRGSIEVKGGQFRCVEGVK